MTTLFVFGYLILAFGIAVAVGKLLKEK